MRHLFCISIIFFLLVGCQSAPKRDSDGLINIIPTKEKDRGPSREIDMSHVPDAVPKKEPRTIAGNKSPYKVKGVVYHVMSKGQGYEEVGLASWYGKKFHGNNTSNGERYDMYAMTAAHKTLPIPSYVRVKNLENNKEIVVRVNDRGPFAAGRIIDLSYAGAQRLGFTNAGTAKVRVTYIDMDSLPAQSVNASTAEPAPVSQSAAAVANETAEKGLFLQVGAFSSSESARNSKDNVERHTQWPVNVNSAKNQAGRLIHRVHIGPLPDQATLEVLQSALLEKGISELVRVVK